MTTSVAETERRKMTIEATERLFAWIKTTELAIPDQVAFDLGVIIGRVRILEEKEERNV